ncbi:hypothetical protein VKT23_009627 [Stygiomarasmius scandens]|uniref:Uncharacterized protein n=1 Tax=Marasmiellus scandens TaxID=2682957 RepID=A0ABR1JE81_9AGAR
MSDKIMVGLVVPDKGVTLKYGGNTNLTIDPAIASTSTITKDQTITIPKNDSKYEFSANGSVVASIWNRDDVDKVEITGGNKVAGTSPFTVTVALK